MLVSALLLVICSAKISNGKVHAKNNLKTYFPVNSDRKLQFSGHGNEFASFTRTVKFRKDNLIQIHEDNGGTIVAKIYQVCKNKVLLLKEVPEFYNNKNLLHKSSNNYNKQEIILKKPLEVGTTWQNKQQRRKIVKVNQTVKVPAGQFDNVIKIKIVTNKQGNQFKRYEYYAKGLGLIKQESINQNYEIVAKLSSYEKQRN